MNDLDEVLGTKHAELYGAWREKSIIAKENMTKRLNLKGELIEVAAQHPLINGVDPNEELKKRLELGIKIYNNLISDGVEVKIYVPGSLHQFEGVKDKISLSEAGKRFLIKHGVPESDIYAEDANNKYMKETGVYNSVDECYVACKLFESLNYRKIHCVCSSGQAFRKVLSYIHFGYIPYIHTVSCDNMHHDYIDEIFTCIPQLLVDKKDGNSNSNSMRDYWDNRRGME